jgi:hypothetical protein
LDKLSYMAAACKLQQSNAYLVSTFWRHTRPFKSSHRCWRSHEMMWTPVANLQSTESTVQDKFFHRYTGICTEATSGSTSTFH